MRQPYSTGDDLNTLLSAASAIDAELGQPALLRHATVRFDVWAGAGTLPCPLVQATEVRLNGEALTVGDYGISGGVFQLAGRAAPLRPSRHIAEIDGIVGYGEVAPAVGLQAQGSELIADRADRALPVGTVLYNGGTLVHVQSVDGTVMRLSGEHTSASVRVVQPPAAIIRASRTLAKKIALFTSTAPIGGDGDPDNDVMTAEVAELLRPSCGKPASPRATR